MMKKIEHDGIVLARLISTKTLGEGLTFYSDAEDFLQVGLWNYNQGKKLNRHYHNRINRNIIRTHECLYVIEGKILAQIYNLDLELIEEIKVEQGDILILQDCGHGYSILEDNTKVIEIKNGPYLGAENDRERF